MQDKKLSLFEALTAAIISLPVSMFKHGVSFNVTFVENLRGTISCAILGVLIYYINRRFWDWYSK